MARTMARNEPEIRTLRTSTISMSLPTASTSSNATSSIGCQSRLLETRRIRDRDDRERSHDTRRMSP